MVVPNPCTSDARVIKEAESLAAAGYAVRVLCRADGRAPQQETRNGVEYRRLPFQRWPWFLHFVIPRRWRRAVIGRARSAAPAAGLPPPVIELTPREIVRRLGNLARALFWRLARLSGVILIVPPEWIRAEAAAWRPAIVHVHDLAPLLAGAEVARELDARLVYDAHELETHRNGLGLLARWQAGIVERAAIRTAAAVITVCGSIARHLAAQYGIAEPAVILNAPDAEVEAVPGRTLRDTIGLAAEVPLALYVGKLTFGRGLEQLVEAMPHCPEFHVALLGPRVEWVEQELRRRADRLGVTARLHFVDSVPPAQVVGFSRGADLGVVPIQDVCLSYRYCMPNKLFELAFAGIPVCVSDLPEMRAFVERERTGLVMDQTDPIDIAAKLRELYRRRGEFRPDTARRAALVQAYAWPRQAAVLVDLYRRLLAAGAARPAQ